MALDVGVNVLEVDGRSVPAIQGAPTSVGAFLGRTDRGPLNRPVRVTNMAQFSDRFGNFLADGYLAYALDGFFLNGGREAYACRVGGSGGAVGVATLADRVSPAAGNALRVAAGYRGQEEPGTWASRLRIDVRDDPRASTVVIGIVGPTAPNSYVVGSLTGLHVGSIVRFLDSANNSLRRIVSIIPASHVIEVDSAVPAPIILTTQVVSAEFRITVRYRSLPSSDFAVVEEWPTLSMETASADYVVDRINHPFTGSRYIVVADLSGATAFGVENPAIKSNETLSGGADPVPAAADFAGSSALRTGLFSFDTAQVQLLAVPDVHGPSVAPAARNTIVRAALDYCDARGDCMYVGSGPDRGKSAGPTTLARARRDYNELESDYVVRLRSYASIFQGRKVYGALYAPWIQVSDPVAAGTAPTKFVPADGHVMGVYARTEMERGIFKAPAGNAALLRGALDVAAGFSDGQHTDLVRTGYLNGVRFLPGLGIVIAASRTLSTDTRWWFVGTRLLFNFVKSSLRDGLRFVRQEPHTGELRRSVSLNVVRPFLLGLWRQGAFGADAPDDVFTIKCDAENNPPTEVDLGNFKIEVYFYPVKPAETILIVVGQQPSGATAAEA